MSGANPGTRQNLEAWSQRSAEVSTSARANGFYHYSIQLLPTAPLPSSFRCFTLSAFGAIIYPFFFKLWVIEPNSHKDARKESGCAFLPRRSNLASFSTKALPWRWNLHDFAWLCMTNLKLVSWLHDADSRTTECTGICTPLSIFKARRNYVGMRLPHLW